MRWRSALATQRTKLKNTGSAELMVIEWPATRLPGLQP